MYEYTEALMKVLLIIVYRIMHFNEQNPELSHLYHIKTEIKNKYLMDFPRLLQLIEIYGESNPQIMKIIVKQFIKLD